jgi:hypothetical protein
MITCKCGKAIEKVPSWMQGIQVDFVCNNCPDRQAKNIALMALELETAAAAKASADLTIEDEEEAEEPEADAEA